MKHIKKPLKNDILKISAVTFSVLCVLLTLMNYFSYRSLLFSRYQNHMESILANTVTRIDVDDLAECIRTGEKSQAFLKLQTEMDMCKDNTQLHYLYIIIPLNTDEEDNIRNVIAAISQEQYKNAPEDSVELNGLSGKAYSSRVAALYLDAFDKDEISYFENVTDFGHDYTAVLPLSDSNGNKVAELCVDVEMNEIQELLLYHSIRTIALTLLVGLLTSVVFLIWTKRRIIRPIETLEQSVAEYMENGLDSKDPDSLVLGMPDIHTRNEVESLAHKIVLMSEALYVTVSGMLFTKEELAQMSVIAHKDELTNVGNKSAYAEYAEKLRQSIKDGSAEFAVVMADINLLKYINDTYGHEKGDRYIRKCCGILCDIYQHSPVFRVGGDEFIIFLRDRDYHNRDDLLHTAKERLKLEQSAPGAEPWDAASIALGMSVFSPGSDTSVREVVSRADEAMYADKKRAHKKRKPR